jgi:tRNA threonylcarbamoyladenosine biosynthesis protein TsaB
VRILGFDTATRSTAVALTDSVSGLELQARDDPPAGQRPGHTTQLMALIADLLARADWGWRDLDRIAVGVGPGTFTGLRIGVATARALARARGIELVGVSTLRSLALAAAAAAQADPEPCDAVVPALDARRGEVFAAAWEAAAAATRGPVAALLEPAPMAPEELARRALGLGKRRLIVGDGAVAFRQVLEGSGTVIPGNRSDLHRVDATYHCRLAQQVQPTGADDVVPEYLRVPDAELTLQASQPR